MKAPFISIGVATYDRKLLLRETLASILSQSFQDFEILVGNNHVELPLSGEALGIPDARIRYLNHPQNLGQQRNMNSVLAAATGKYFTWLNDDDLYQANFLEVVVKAIEAHSSLDCVFTGYELFTEPRSFYSLDCVNPPVLSLGPADFLEQYLTKAISVIGCYGMFRRDFLNELGGMPSLGAGPLLYADNLLALKVAVGGKFVLVDAPLVGFRSHGGSVSNQSQDLHSYHRLQAAFFSMGAELFSSLAVARYRDRFLYLLARWFLDDGMAVAMRARQLRPHNLVDYSRMVYHFAVRIGPSGYSLALVWSFLKKLVRVAVYRLRK